MNQGLVIERIEAEKKKMIFHWSDETQSSCSYLFLRDNCDSSESLHLSGQRIIDPIQIPDDISPSSWTLNDDKTVLTINWNHKDHLSEFTSSWLRLHSYSKGHQHSEAAHMTRLWDRALNAHLPEKDFEQIGKSEEEFAVWLGFIQQWGFGILHNVPALPNYVLEVIRLFGFVRETNYGKVFDVRTKTNPNNLAFSNLGIPPHTDNPYRHPVPTLQLLHCLRSNTKGGDSILVDGFHLAEEMRTYHPDAFRLLAKWPLKYRFRDKQTWLENSVPVISLDANEHVNAIAYNHRSVCPFEIPEEEMDSYYEAYRIFGHLAADPEFQIRFSMQRGDLYMVNNERILHARSAYDDLDGERWLQGAYADIDGLMSTLRICKNKS
jgi:gamma-butyrobetaine dioxygenase